MQFILRKDKVTKGAVRYSDSYERYDHPHLLYLTKEEATELGNPEHIVVTIQEG